MIVCPSLRSFLTAAAFVLLAISGGCIHPNLPSVRYGTQAHPTPEEIAVTESFEVTEVLQHDGQEFVDESYCEGDGYLTDRSGSHHQPDTPEAPWPRFHPLPTRPVLGPN